MIGIIVGTHGALSQEIVNSTEMIFGKQENVQAVTFHPGESADVLVEKFTAAFKGMDCPKGVLFLVDIFGGSPYNAASRIAIQQEKMDIVTGVNVPMLLEVFAARSFLGLSDLVHTAISVGTGSIKSFKSMNNSVEEEL